MEPEAMRWWYWFGMWIFGITSIVLTWWLFLDAARRQGIREGRVRLLMEVDITGRVREVRVLSAEPPGYFEAASVDAARQWRFTPGRVADRDVVTRFELPIHFGGEGP